MLRPIKQTGSAIPILETWRPAFSARFKITLKRADLVLATVHAGNAKETSRWLFLLLPGCVTGATIDSFGMLLDHRERGPSVFDFRLTAALPPALKRRARRIRSAVKH
jgi:hypothetical protein